MSLIFSTLFPTALRWVTFLPWFGLCALIPLGRGGSGGVAFWYGSPAIAFVLSYLPYFRVRRFASVPLEASFEQTFSRFLVANSVLSVLSASTFLGEVGESHLEEAAILLIVPMIGMTCTTVLLVALFVHNGLSFARRRNRAETSIPSSVTTKPPSLAASSIAWLDGLLCCERSTRWSSPPRSPA